MTTAKKLPKKKIDEKEMMQEIKLRLPVDSAAYIENYKAEAVRFLNDFIEYKMDPDGYQARREQQGKALGPKPMLHRAEELINGQRQADYGDKLQNFSQIAMFIQAILAPKLQPGAEIIAEDAVLIMVGVKMARLTKTPRHSDSILDVAGYAGCYDKLQAEREAGVTLQGAINDAGWYEQSSCDKE